jgi:methionine aminopeptidase
MTPGARRARGRGAGGVEWGGGGEQVGSADEETEALALAAKECVEQAIAVVGAGVNYHALAVAVHGYASKHGAATV